MAKHIPSWQPTQLMPAARPSEPEIEVVFDEDGELVPLDPDPLGDRPTDPLPPEPSATDTIRPPSCELDSLRTVSRTGAGWLDEPRVAFDRELGVFALAGPYRALQADKHGNTFRVDCYPGTLIPTPADWSDLRTETVKAQLLRQPLALIRPFTGANAMEIVVDPQWRKAILQAFREGDRGDRERGGSWGRD